MRVIVSSTAKQKIEAVQSAFQLLTEKNIVVEGFKAPSNINEQPLGRVEMNTGCNNRLAEAMKNEVADVYVSMENGIEFVDGEWRDFAYIIMYLSKSRQEFDGFSDFVVFPTDCVEEAQRLGFDLHTVGSVMAELKPEIDKQDPHLSLTGKSRVAFLSETIEKLIEQANATHLFDRMT
jgi:non-canonical (house-cleaning) NTP pyrophosphatase